MKGILGKGLDKQTNQNIPQQEEEEKEKGGGGGGGDRNEPAPADWAGGAVCLVDNVQVRTHRFHLLVIWCTQHSR